VDVGERRGESGERRLKAVHIPLRRPTLLFAVKTEKEWRVAGGKYVGKMVRIYGEAARAVAEAINAI